MSFNRIPDPIDLYIKDNQEDTGKQPNKTTESFWQSPSILVRNQDDGIRVHENPVYSSTHKEAYVYVKIENRGKCDYTGGQWLHLYWALASTGLTPKVWKGLETTNMGYKTGGLVNIVPISGTIKPDESSYVTVKWELPKLIGSTKQNTNHHYCLMAEIKNSSVSDPYIEGETLFPILESNDLAQKNVSIIKEDDLTKETGVFLRDVLLGSGAYSLEFIPHSVADRKLFEYADVKLKMTPVVSAAWERGGGKSQDITVLSQSTSVGSRLDFKINTPEGKFSAIKLNRDEFDMISLSFAFKAGLAMSQKFTYDLIQKDAAGNIVGGETFIIHAPKAAASQPTISSFSSDGNEYLLEVAENEDEYETFEWSDNTGAIIGSEKSISVIPSVNSHEYTVTTYNKDGELGKNSVDLISEIGITAIDILDNGVINISLANSSNDNAEIAVNSIADGTLCFKSPVKKEDKNLVIDLSALPSGQYVIVYLINNEIADSKKINI